MSTEKRLRLLPATLGLVLATSALGQGQSTGAEPAASEGSAPQAGEPEVSASEVARLVDEYLAATQEAPEERSWERVFDRLSVYGDLRLRTEHNFNRPTAADGNRERLRMRFGAIYSVSETLEIGTRIVTGNPDDPNSSHQTLGDGLSNYRISLDRAYATWRPESAYDIYLTGGKFAPGVQQNPVYGELVWDGDVQPEGAQGGFVVPVGGAVENIDLRAGYYILEDNAASGGSGTTMVQASGNAPMGSSMRTRASVAYYYYDNPHAVIGDNSGNASMDTTGNGVPDQFTSEFGILHPIVAFDYLSWKMPLTLAGEYVKNFRANIDDDQGYSIGASLGSTRKKGDWWLFYQWQYIEQDALFSAFAQDDFLLATNHQSHVAGVNYQLTDKVGLRLWSLVSKFIEPPAGIPNDDQWRVRLDLNMKF